MAMLSHNVRFVLVLGLAYGQSHEFEVASVRYLGPYSESGMRSIRGGPGTNDPEHLFYENVTLLFLLNRAYGVPFDQIYGPGWLDSEEYTVIANIPQGTTKAELHLMLQHLLQDRFHLVVHTAKRELPTYKIVIAKDGPRLTPSKGVGGTIVPGARPTRGDDGFPVLPPGGRHGIFQPVENGVQVTRETFRDFSMQDLASELAWPLAGPSAWPHSISTARVIDATGLPGKFDFRLVYSGNHGPGGAIPVPEAGAPPSDQADLFGALERQLGLKIVEAKAMFDVLIVDRLDKRPTEN